MKEKLILLQLFQLLKCFLASKYTLCIDND